MSQDSFLRKRIIHIYVVSLMVIIMFLVAGFFMLKYNVEGEKNVPFKLNKINIISTAESDIKQDEEENWYAGILQKNDIFLTIEKNEKYDKIDTIKQIKLENFNIIKNNENTKINMYRAKSNSFDYTYSDDFKIEDKIEYDGAQETNLEAVLINNQGGTIGISITQSNFSDYSFSINESQSGERSTSNFSQKSATCRFSVSP